MLMGATVHTVKENAETLVVTKMETGLEVNAGKSTYIVKSRDQNTGQSHSIKIYK